MFMRAGRVTNGQHGWIDRGRYNCCTYSSYTISFLVGATQAPIRRVNINSSYTGLDQGAFGPWPLGATHGPWPLAPWGPFGPWPLGAEKPLMDRAGDA